MIKTRLSKDEIFDQDGALTARFLLLRGYCCANGCRNCPYEPRHGGLDARPQVEIAAREGIPVFPSSQGAGGATIEGS